MKKPLNPVESGAATVIARVHCDRRVNYDTQDQRDFYVLCFLGLDHVTPYVTWREFPATDENSAYYEHGEYFYAGQIADAVLSLQRRAGL